MSEPSVTFIDAGPDAISAETVLKGVSPAEIYALVANPRRHHELDGGGNVRAQIAGPEYPGVGEQTTQSMKLYGIPYSITATVVCAEPDLAFAWSMPGGHTWAWDILPNDDDTITVRETFDASKARAFGLPLARFYRLNGGFARNRRSIELSLKRLHHLFAR